MFAFGEVQRDERICEIEFVEMIGIFIIDFIRGAVDEFKFDQTLVGGTGEFPLLGDGGARGFSVGLRLVDAHVVHAVVVDAVNEYDVPGEGIDEGAGLKEGQRILGAGGLQQFSLGLIRAWNDPVVDKEKKQTEDDSHPHQRN